MRATSIPGLRFVRSFAKGFLHRLGYTVIRADVSQQNLDAEFEEILRIVRPYTMVALEGLQSLYAQVLFCEMRGVAGDYVECGVWKGGAVAVMALANLKHSEERRQIHLFDVFDDICQPDARIDGARAIREAKDWGKIVNPEGKLEPMRGVYDRKGGHGTVEGNKDLLERVIGYSSQHVHYHRGWFQETLPQAAAAIQRIAILRIDADWYASTKVCLEHLFAKVVRGGFVIIDDYGAYEGCKKAVDDFLSGLEHPHYLNRVNKDIRYMIRV